jgi:hypothetical protein
MNNDKIGMAVNKLLTVCTRQELDAYLSVLSAFHNAFPTVPRDEQESAMLVTVVNARISPDVFGVAMKKAVINGKFYPSIAEVMCYARRIMRDVGIVSEHPAEVEAWYEVMEHVKGHKSQWSDPLIEQTVKRMGGCNAIAMSEECMLPSWRTTFYKAYAKACEYEVDKEETMRLVAAAGPEAILRIKEQNKKNRELIERQKSIVSNFLLTHSFSF